MILQCSPFQIYELIGISEPVHETWESLFYELFSSYSIDYHNHLQNLGWVIVPVYLMEN